MNKEDVVIKKFSYSFKNEFFQSGLATFDKNGEMISVLFDDEYAHEGLSVDNFIEFLQKAGYEFNDSPIKLTEEEFENAKTKDCLM